MGKPRSTPKKRAADLATARKAGGNDKQSHLMGRLKAEMKRRAISGKAEAAKR